MVCKQGLELLQNRRSVRNLDPDRQVTEAEIDEIMKAAINAPNAHNKQLWHFTVVQNAELIAELAEQVRQGMLRGNEEQVKKANTPGYSPLHHAPTVIFIFGNLADDFYIQTDCAIAAGMIIAAAENLGLQSCFTGSSAFMFRGEEGNKFREVLGVPEGYMAIGSVAIGHVKGDMPKAPEKKKDVITYVR